MGYDPFSWTVIRSPYSYIAPSLLAKYEIWRKISIYFSISSDLIIVLFCFSSVLLYQVTTKCNVCMHIYIFTYIFITAVNIAQNVTWLKRWVLLVHSPACLYNRRRNIYCNGGGDVSFTLLLLSAQKKWCAPQGLYIPFCQQRCVQQQSTRLFLFAVCCCCCWCFFLLLLLVVAASCCCCCLLSLLLLLVVMSESNGTQLVVLLA